ncbi:MAG: LLM class flavin-dependent oxidoreductase [Thermocrispum sp.]
MLIPEHRWSTAAPQWRAAEQYGFDHAWTYDHLGWRSFVDSPWFSAMPTLTAAALVTERIELGTMVASAAFRHPVPFAREAIHVDDVCDGRLLLGVGAGTIGTYDYTVFGETEPPPKQKADRFVEFTEALDGLLRTDDFDHHGEYFTAVGARNLPGSTRQPRVPLLVAANGPRTIRFAAGISDGWITTGRGGDDAQAWWQGVAELAERFTAALDGAGRDPGEVRRYLYADAGPAYCLTSVDAFTDAAQRAARLGFTDLVVHWPRPNEPFHGDPAVLEELAAGVLDGVRELG